MFFLTRYVNVFLILQWGLFMLSLGTFNFAIAYQERHAAIPLKEFTEELRNEPSEFAQNHILMTYIITGFGDRLYNLTEDVSAECAQTTAATVMIMWRLLTMHQEIDDIAELAKPLVVDDVKRDFGHPVEYLCQRMQKYLIERPKLNSVFERIKKLVENGSVRARGRPPYSHKLFRDATKFQSFLEKKLKTVKELGKTFSNMEFMVQQNKTEAFSLQYALFSKSVVAMARKEEVTTDAPTLQSLYEKTLGETADQISNKMKLGAMVLNNNRTYFFTPIMMRRLYRNIAEHPVLKKELESTATTLAANLGKHFENIDQDFSKM